jgi:hypothetical protein
MPLIRKKRIWWEPVTRATGYVVYVGTDNKVADPAKFSWEDTAGMIFKQVNGKTTELVIPDEWPEFPRQPGVYHIAVTSRDDAGNESDPFFLSGVFSLVAPASPSKGGIEDFPLALPEPGDLDHSSMSRGRTIISRGLEEVEDNKEVGNAYLGKDLPVRNRSAW